MPIRIFTNVSSLNAQRFLAMNTTRVGLSLERVANGIRINRGSDDIAGLAISESLRSDTRALGQAVRNTNDGISLLDVAEGAMNIQSGILIRLRELSSQSASGTIGENERQTLQLEFSALRAEFDRIAATTEFNSQKLLDGSLASGVSSQNHLSIQVGIESTENDRLNLNREIDINALNSKTLGFQSASISTVAGALSSLDKIESAVNNVTQARGKVGATQNRLLRTASNLNVSIENLSAADSTIRDADIAEEIALLTRNQILTAASIAMVGATNLQPQAVLQFLR